MLRRLFITLHSLCVDFEQRAANAAGPAAATAAAASASSLSKEKGGTAACCRPWAAVLAEGY